MYWNRFSVERLTLSRLFDKNTAICFFWSKDISSKGLVRSARVSSKLATSEALFCPLFTSSAPLHFVPAFAAFLNLACLRVFFFGPLFFSLELCCPWNGPLSSSGYSTILLDSDGPGSLSSMSSLLPPVISVEQQWFINDMITFCVAKSCQQRKLLQALHFTSFQNLELQESWRNEGSNVRKITSQWELTCLHLIGRFAGRWGWIIDPGLIGLSRD